MKSISPRCQAGECETCPRWWWTDETETIALTCSHACHHPADAGVLLARPWWWGERRSAER